MSKPQEIADEVLSRCARHCCICRRFKPLHLQVHHIDERSEGGSDDFDNLIAVCLTCHSDVHTQTKLTRRFTKSELKLHRNEVYRLVADGKLPATEVSDAVASASRFAVSAIANGKINVELVPEAAEMLISAATTEGGWQGVICRLSSSSFETGKGKHGEGFNNRERACYRGAFEQLVNLGLIAHDVSFQWSLTNKGYLIADVLLAAGSQVASHS